MSPAIKPLVFVLAVARLTTLITQDEISRPFREWAVSRSDWLGYLVTCPRCAGIWSAFAVLLMPDSIRVALALGQTVVFNNWVGEVIEVKLSESK